MLVNLVVGVPAVVGVPDGVAEVPEGVDEGVVEGVVLEIFSATQTKKTAFY